MELSKVQLKARLNAAGDKVLCGIVLCNGALAYVSRRDLSGMGKTFSELDREIAMILVREGYSVWPDGSWRMGSHATRRQDLQLDAKDRTLHEISKRLPLIVSGNATPEEHEAFAELLREKDVSLPTSRVIDKATVIYCPKCRRPNVVDPAQLL